MSEIEACRTCGIFFLMTSNYLRHLLGSEPEMLHVRRELETWNIKLNEDDRFPQYICTVCLLEFRKIFQFQHACLETQNQLRHLYTIQQENMNKIKIKTEMCDDKRMKKESEYNLQNIGEQNVCAFIYVDDVSDSEYGNEGEITNVTKFKVPHVPIKWEFIEEARLPHVFSEASNNKIQEATEKSVLVSTPESLNNSEEEPESEQVDTDVNEPALFSNGIQCELCLHVSVNQQEHRQHLLRIHESKPLECHICGKQFKAGTTKTRLKYHLKWHRLNKHIKCPQCGFHCASRDVLNEHKRAVHTKTPCKLCGKRFLAKKMRIHMEEHQLGQTEIPRFECTYCLGDFGNELERDHHILSTHFEVTANNSTEDSLEEDFIDMEKETTEDSSETETSSIASSSTVMSFSPDNNTESQMPQYFLSYENTDLGLETDDSYETMLESEMSTVNLTAPVLDEMLFACAQCPISFPKVEQLIAHAETHQDKALFCCKICGKKFDLKFSLNRHMKRHKNFTF